MVNRIEGRGSNWLGAVSHDVANAALREPATVPQGKAAGSRTIDFGNTLSPLCPEGASAGKLNQRVSVGSSMPLLSTEELATGKLPTAATPAVISKTPVANLHAIDQSKYSNPEALEKWAGLLSDLPEKERESAAKELNRPIAAAKMLRDGGKNAENALAYIRENPALYTAMDTSRDGGVADGFISNRDISSFVKNMTHRAEDAAKTVSDYVRRHPDADPQALRLVQSSALLLANEPLLRAADPAKSATHASPIKTDRTATLTDLNAVVKDNHTLSPQLKAAAKLWSHPGLFGLLEHADVKGEKLARVAHDGKLMMKDMISWINEQAPASRAEVDDTLHNAATLGLAEKTDISRLDEDIFASPQSYSAAQKAATLVKLQQTLEQVIAGRQYRDTSATERALNQRIDQLQQDRGVIQYFGQDVPCEIQRIMLSDPVLAQTYINQPRHSSSPAQGRAAGLEPSMSMSQGAAGTGMKSENQLVKDTARHVMDFSKASLHADNLAQSAGGKVAIGLAGKMGSAIAGRVVGAVAGEAAGAAAATAVGAAAGPVGWADGGALSLGMGIAELVSFFNAKSKLKNRRADFAKTVNPTLEQFNIAKPR
ncbi:type III effector HrpK [Brenneria roseae subsp. americana]|uniref:Type III effector HrpK n=1 Tax=Brenneria roseae subsp. americana TaxID=1508507 RepID=A0A2U1TTQ1_9GAMM|nr:type III effector HrpK domain-containing protein [Brenneria roseae]PWC12786.1 type III effector HrpK [Brenneria roseae subsp. americana]